MACMAPRTCSRAMPRFSPPRQSCPCWWKSTGCPRSRTTRRPRPCLPRLRACAACSWPRPPGRAVFSPWSRAAARMRCYPRWAPMPASNVSIRRRAARSHSGSVPELRAARMLRHLPNFICLVRIALIWPTIDSLYSGNYWTALALVAVCAVSDGLDGWLAKRFNWTSHLGKILDPLADKLLLVALFLTATWMNLLPWWLTAVAVGRDVMIGFGAVIYRVWFGPLHGRPTLLSKINTGMQLAVALAAILGAATGMPTEEMVTALAIVTLVTTVISGAGYLGAFTRRALTT